MGLVFQLLFGNVTGRTNPKKTSQFGVQTHPEVDDVCLLKRSPLPTFTTYDFRMDFWKGSVIILC